ncbi:hypothetical protein MY5147_007303 [Beauveria neobassiana]
MKSESTRPTAIITLAQLARPDATCGVPGCFATPDRLSNKTLPWYCNAHTQAVRLPVIVEGYVLYMLHCAPSMAAQASVVKTRLCAKLMAKMRGTRRLHTRRKIRRPMHQCDGDCTEHRHSNKVFQPDSFCRLPGCNRLRQTKEGGESEWCEKPLRQATFHDDVRAALVRRRALRPGRAGPLKLLPAPRHECQRARCLNKAVPGTDHCPRHLEESRKREEEKKVAEEREKEKKEKKKKESEGYRREPRHCYQTAVVTPLVIVDEDGVRSEYAREPSPVCRRGGLRYPYPDCLDDAYTGRVHRGYDGGSRGRVGDD